MKLYLAGPMRGIADHNFPAFDAAAEHLRSLGHEVVNPADLSRDSGVEYNSDGTCTTEQLRELLTIDLAWLVDCEGIALLPGWQKSEGAKLELLFVTMTGMRVFSSTGEEYIAKPSLVVNVIYDGRTKNQEHVAEQIENSPATGAVIQCSCGARWAVARPATVAQVWQSIADHYWSAGQKPSEVL